ncbi:MAG: integrase [Syntrophus sp. (in: bacteria)]|nr:integrase [Syntrophus sp. (in: bacteria)]
MKLTKKRVESLALPESGQVFVWDSDVKGFGLRLTPGGRAYIIQNRVNGVTRRVSLGKHGIITLDEARKKAVAELSKMLEGKDPVAEKAHKKAYSKTLRALADDYIQSHNDLKITSIADINKHVDRSFSIWRDRPVTEITRDKVAVRFQELTERSSAQANQAFRILRALLNYARAAYRAGNKPIIVENPVDILSQTKVWNRVTPKSAKIPLDKIGIAWNLLQSMRADDFSSTLARTAADIVAFLLLTGARWSEAAKLTWEQVDLESKSWHLPDPKNRNPVTFPLSNEAVAILEARGQDKSYIFSSWGERGHITEARGVFNKVSKAVGADVTAHDFRRTFRAIAGECQIDFWKTKLLMGHKLSGDITITHYTETSDLRYLSDEVNKIADWIVRQGKIAAAGNIIQLSHRGAL